MSVMNCHGAHRDRLPAELGECTTALAAWEQRSSKIQIAFEPCVGALLLRGQVLVDDGMQVAVKGVVGRREAPGHSLLHRFCVRFVFSRDVQRGEEPAPAEELEQATPELRGSGADSLTEEPIGGLRERPDADALSIAVPGDLDRRDLGAVLPHQIDARFEIRAATGGDLMEELEQMPQAGKRDQVRRVLLEVLIDPHRYVPGTGENGPGPGDPPARVAVLETSGDHVEDVVGDLLLCLVDVTHGSSPTR